MIPTHEILEKLDYLRTHDTDLRIFGARPENGWGHAYKMDPVMPESEVIAFEQATGLRLPEDFRAFITQVCNGGPGPGYGFFGLAAIREEWVEGYKTPFSLSNDAFNGCVAICTMGCGIEDYLVINGDKDCYGRMASGNGFGDVFLMGTFLEEYMWWLDDSIKQVKGLKPYM